jgi:sulfur carrier protein ThiS
VRVTFKLFATLQGYLPEEYEGRARVGRNELPVVVPEGTTLQALIDRFPMPRALVHLVLVNGEYILPAERADHVLREGDAVAIWPPIAGG